MDERQWNGRFNIKGITSDFVQFNIGCDGFRAAI